jgi:exo-beta-1,3-glucanase (GH17 family)
LTTHQRAFRTSKPVAFGAPLALFLISLTTITAVWWWLARPVALGNFSIDPAIKLDCVSYAPFRDDQTPFDHSLIIKREQIEQDLAKLATISGCVRIYSVDNGLDKVPELAAKAGLKVILGVWIGRDRLKNVELVDRAISLTKEYPGVITALIVGSEVLLRGEMTASDLRQIIRSAKARTDVPVGYADVWEFWLRYREVSDDVDFITIHILPYWEDFPIRAESAAAHVDDIRKQIVLAFPGKQILIGETGWPSRGRMRDGALPSLVNQARFVAEILDRARQENFRVNFFEAYDEPWKREWEGTVGGYWGLFGNDRILKYPPGIAVSNHPFWKLQLGSGLALGIAVFAAAIWTLKRRRSWSRPLRWAAVACCATVGGILFGLSVEDMLYESYGPGGWLVRGLLLAAGVAAPILSVNALMSKRPLPTFLELMGPHGVRNSSFPTMVLGGTLTVTTLIAADTALAFVFDARWRDFPFAGLTMAIVPFWLLRLLNDARSGVRPVAETVFAGLFVAASIYMIFNEGFLNWQSLWTAGAYILLATTLLQARFATASAMPVIVAGAGLAREEGDEAFTDERRTEAEAAE